MGIYKTDLDNITKSTFKDAINMVLSGKIMGPTPLGQPRNVLIHGIQGSILASQVSIGRFCGDPQLVVTSRNGEFLFIGQFNLSYGVGFITKQFWDVFCAVRGDILLDVERPSL